MPTGAEKEVAVFRRLGMVILLATLVWAMHPAVPAFATTSPIVFANHGDLYVIDGSGAGLTRLTHTTRHEGSPAWSPDGTAIAFSVGPQIWIMHADGTHVRKVLGLSKGFIVDSVAWSPGGKRLAIQAERKVRGSPARYCSSVWTVSSSGGSLTRIHQGEDPGDGITWSPDGRWLAVGFQFINGTTDCSSSVHNGLFRMHPDGSGFQSLHAPLGRDPDWSPGGGLIAFDDWRHTCHACGQLWVMKPDGSGQHRILGSGFGASFFQPRWSPGGSAIAYVHPTSAGAGLWVMRRDTSNQHRIFNDTSAGGWVVEDW